MMQHRLIELQRQIYLEARSTAWPLPQLMPWLIDRRNLDGAWERVRAADGAKAPGPDGLSVLDWDVRKEMLLRELTSRLYKGSFRPTPPRMVAIPKPDGGTRMLGILNVRDRVVHAALKQVLEPMLDPTFAPHSFGFRPGRSVPGALVTATRLLSSGPGGTRPAFDYVLKADVDRCFDTIDHGLLLERLGRVTRDEDVLRLVASILASVADEGGWFWRRRPRGVVQGSGLSPLLCNFYLDDVDRALEALSRRHAGGIRSLRYADDLLVLTRGRRLAVKARACLRRALRQGRQRANADKLQLSPAILGVRWLGVDLRPRELDRDGRVEFAYYVPETKVDAMLERLAEMTVPPSTRIDPAAFALGRWLGSINEQLRDWWSSYMYAENAAAAFRKLDQFAYDRVGSLLHSVTGLRQRALREQYAVRLPRGFRSWQIEGTRMTVLSSLAPRNPDRLFHPPPWQRRGHDLSQERPQQPRPARGRGLISAAE